MDQVPEPSKPVRCKLCAAFAASQMFTAAERGFRGSETFSRNPDICDACLAHDYATIPWRVRFSLEWYVAQVFGCFFVIVAYLTLEYIHRKKGFEHFLLPPRFDPIVINLLLAIVAGACFTVLVWLVLKAMFWLSRWPIREEMKIDRAEQAPISAERFRWLARWAELNGRKRFCKRMLKQAAGLDARFGRRG